MIPSHNKLDVIYLTIINQEFTAVWPLLKIFTFHYSVTSVHLLPLATASTLSAQAAKPNLLALLEVQINTSVTV